MAGGLISEFGLMESLGSVPVHASNAPAGGAGHAPLQCSTTGAGCVAACFLDGRSVFGWACWPVVSIIAFFLPSTCIQLAVITLPGTGTEVELALTSVTKRRRLQPAE